MLSPALVICAPTNPAFRFATNLLSTALLTRLLFHPLLFVSKASADRGRAGIWEKGKRTLCVVRIWFRGALLIRNIQM